MNQVFRAASGASFHSAGEGACFLRRGRKSTARPTPRRQPVAWTSRSCPHRWGQRTPRDALWERSSSPGPGPAGSPKRHVALSQVPAFTIPGRTLGAQSTQRSLRPGHKDPGRAGKHARRRFRDRPKPTFSSGTACKTWGGRVELLLRTPPALRRPARSRAGKVKSLQGLNFETGLGKSRFPVPIRCLCCGRVRSHLGRRGLWGPLAGPALSAAPPWISVSCFSSGN